MYVFRMLFSQESNDHMLTKSLNMIRSHGVIHTGVSDHSLSYLIWKANHVHSGVNYVTY